MRYAVALAIALVLAFSAGALALHTGAFSSSFDRVTAQGDEAVLEDWDACEGCDVGSLAPGRFDRVKKPVQLSPEGALLHRLEGTDALTASFDIDSTEGHRIRFLYRAIMTADTGEEGAYVSFSYGETGGICEFGFVISSEGIALSRTPDGEVEHWDLTVTPGEWDEVVLETGPCQEPQPRGLFLISVTSPPGDWGSVLIDEVSVE